jgi:hypothetical protein
LNRWIDYLYEYVEEGRGKTKPEKIMAWVLYGK